MVGKSDRHAAALDELVESWQDLARQKINSRAVLLPVQPRWGRTHLLNQFAAVVYGSNVCTGIWPSCLFWYDEHMNASSQQAWENFRKRVAELGGEVLEPKSLGKDKPHRCRCANGHECWPRPNSIRNGQGMCRICAGNDPVVARDNFYRRVAELGGMVLEQEWLGAWKPHLCRCIDGRECKPYPANVQQGHGICRACAGKDPIVAQKKFYKSIAELGGTVLEKRWLGANTPHLCLCAKGHECKPRPSSVSSGRGICSVCAGNDPVTAWENFRRRVTELGGVVLEPEWLGKDKLHLCRCAKGHECRPLPSHVRDGGGICRICAGQDQTVAWENFRRRVAELGGVVLEPGWLGSGVPHLCRCVNGHECKPRPYHVSAGRGICRICAGNDSVTAWENFRSRVVELGGTVLEPEWLGCQIPHFCRCANGHECRPMPNSVQQGQGICAICAGFEYDVVYIVRNPVMNCVKFGITNSEGKSRLRVHRGNGFTEVIRLETGLLDGLAEIIEKKIRVALDMAGAKPVRGREYFSDEHIALIENEIENWLPLPGQPTPAVMLVDSPIVAMLPPPVTVADDLPPVTVDPFELAAPTPASTDAPSPTVAMA